MTEPKVVSTAVRIQTPTGIRDYELLERENRGITKLIMSMGLHNELDMSKWVEEISLLKLAHEALLPAFQQRWPEVKSKNEQVIKSNENKQKKQGNKE